MLGITYAFHVLCFHYFIHFEILKYGYIQIPFALCVLFLLLFNSKFFVWYKLGIYLCILIADISIKKTVSNFKGYLHIPFEAIACSETCADCILEEFAIIDSGVGKEEKYSFDVPPPESTSPKFLCCS